MPGQIRTVSSLAEEVRSLLDEDNTAAIDTTRDILPALNRGQEVAANILARHYESPLLKDVEVTAEADGSLAIPEDAFEERIEAVEYKTGSYYAPLTALSFRELYKYEGLPATTYPLVYSIVGGQIRLGPKSGSTTAYRLWYLERPRPMVLPQGRITYVNETQEYISVDEVGSLLSTETDNNNSYINIVDGHSGRYKASFQILSIEDTRINLRPTPLRNSVLGQSISTSLASLEVGPDDWISTVHGSPLCFFMDPISNYVVQWAVGDLGVQKLGLPSDKKSEIEKKLEERVERSWVGRENTYRVTHRNKHWNARRK